MSRTSTFARRRAFTLVRLIVALVVVALGATALWNTRAWLAASHESGKKPSADEHGHGHSDGAAPTSIELTDQARKNIGLELIEVSLQTFERTITVPGMVVERPGRSTIEITAPMTGVVTHIYPIEGQAIEPGQPLFDMRLTHEELVQGQSDFLRTAEQLDVIRREVARLEKLEGVVAGKTLLERKYEQQKQEALLHSQQQALVLHGLSEEQIKSILDTRTLLKSLTIRVPPDEAKAPRDEPRYLQVHNLRVEQGQHVEVGTTLCSLLDHAELFIEGKAFEQDAAEINEAAAKEWKVAAVVESRAGKTRIIPGLNILYVSGKVDQESRDLHFYVPLKNVLLRVTKPAEGRRFVYWQFKPGQRMQLRIPTERWEKKMVLPVDAVAIDGIETYVFQPNGKQFVRRAVHLLHRDQFFAVIADDGSLFPGDIVARSGAQQLQLALKNKSGGGIDPHAGHQH